MNVSPKQRGDDFLGGSVEERVNQVAQRRAARNIARYDRKVHITLSLFLVSYMPFLFEDAELSPDRRVVRVIRKLGDYLCHGGVLGPIENVHDLAFALRESVGTNRARHMLNL